MATGDQSDIAARIKALLPDGWFADDAPVLDAVLTGIGNAFAFIYGIIAYTRLQARIRTATDGFLDLVSQDYFGGKLPRYSNESDTNFRNRILANLLSEKCTRRGMIQALTLLTGQAPSIFEPARIQDTGAWSEPTWGYGVAGGWGSIQYPAQVFLKVKQPAGAGVPNVGGWGSSIGGYGIGATEFIGSEMISGAVTPAAIYQTIQNTKPVGVTVWTQIE